MKLFSTRSSTAGHVFLVTCKHEDRLGLIDAFPLKRLRRPISFWYRGCIYSRGTPTALRSETGSKHHLLRNKIKSTQLVGR